MCHHGSAAFGALSNPLELFKGLLTSTSAPATVSEWWIFVSDPVVLQYRGFENKRAVREYPFALRRSAGKSSEYFVTIATAAFVAHRARYQNGPEICSLRLHREFAVRGGPFSPHALTGHGRRTGRIHECPRLETRGRRLRPQAGPRVLMLRASFHFNKFRSILGATD